jgi:hypothetical protein
MTQPRHPARRRYRQGASERGDHRLVRIDDDQTRLLDQITAMYQQRQWEEDPE